MNLYARICADILRFNTAINIQGHKLYRFFSSDAGPLYSTQNWLYGNCKRAVGDARESYICIYVYMYIRKAWAYRCVRYGKPSNSLHNPKERIYGPRLSWYIYAASSRYIYTAFFWVYICIFPLHKGSAQFLCAEEHARKRTKKDRSFRNGPL
jgi:hypothetical protein